MRRGSSDIKLYVADFKVSVLLEDAGSKLEERHKQGIQDQLVVNFFSWASLEIVHYGLLDNEEKHAF